MIRMSTFCALLAGYFFSMVGLLIVPDAMATELPVWEAGVGIGDLSMSHYLGSDESASHGFAYPFFIYRSEYVQADRDGMRAKLFQRDNLRLNVSLNASLPVNSDDNRARKGMDDLDSMLEIGPTLQYRLYKSVHNTHRWKLDFPLRVGLTFDGFDVASRGWIINPSVVYTSGDSRWKQWVSVGPLFAEQRYQQYYYGVDKEFVREGREAHHSQPGYVGMKLAMSLRFKYMQFTVGSFVRYVNLHGAANEDSPLVKAKDNFSFGVAINWRLAQSPNRVRVKSGF